MKMKVSTRVILTVYLVVVIVLCAFLLTTMLNFLSPDYLTHAINTMMTGQVLYKAVYAVIFVAMIIVSFIIMFFGIRKTKPKTASIAISEGGTAAITISALEELASKFVSGISDIKASSVKIRNVENALFICVNISILPEICIPDMVEGLKTGLITYMETYTGIKVKNAKIIVTSISQTDKANKVTGGE